MCQTIENLQTKCGYRNRPSPAAALAPFPLSHQLHMLWTAGKVAVAMAIARSQALSTVVGCSCVAVSVFALVSVSVSVALAVYLSCRCRCCLCLWHVSHVSKCLLIKIRASRIVLVVVLVPIVLVVQDEVGYGSRV